MCKFHKESNMNDKTTISPIVQRNIDIVYAWLDAHNR
jgi:hypothetical protein